MFGNDKNIGLVVGALLINGLSAEISVLAFNGSSELELINGLFDVRTKLCRAWSSTMFHDGKGELQDEDATLVEGVLMSWCSKAMFSVGCSCSVIVSSKSCVGVA